ncbi:MAG: hypothetical protein EOP06_04615 [Proteobacteria bacterium]|nr:MAG: hypothetical protein EOP06_04615 [Pseudomonadota bacterium]
MAIIGKTAELAAGIDADQVEREAVRNGISNADCGTSDERIAGVIDDEIEESGNSWKERQEILEDRSGMILKELVRRSSIMKEAYPFRLDGQSLQHVPSQSGVYEFCLAAAVSPNFRISPNPPASVVFEWISRDALRAYFGPRSQGFRTGWPRAPKFEKRGSRAKQTFEALGKLCGKDFRWSPTPPNCMDPQPKDLKDAGLDIVVWIPWADERFSQFIALGQCGCGRHDVGLNKARDLSLKRLNTWLKPLAAAEPYRCFFLAHHVPSDILLFQLASEGGMVFDRARIAVIAHQEPEMLKSVEGIDYLSLAKRYLSNGN